VVKKHVVYTSGDNKNNFKKALTKKVGTLKWLEIKDANWDYTIEVEFKDDTYKLIQKDSVLLQQMSDAANEEFKDAVKKIADTLKEADDRCQELVDDWQWRHAGRVVVQALRDATNLLTVAKEKAVDEVEKCWKKVGTRRQELRTHRISVVGRVLAGAGAVVIGSMSIAAGAFTGGAASCLGAIGLAKGCVMIAREIASGMASVETSFTVMESSLNLIERNYKDAAGEAKKDRLIANEAIAAILSEAVGASQPSVKSVRQQLTTVRGKTAKLEVNQKKLVKDAMAASEKIDESIEEFLSEMERFLKDRGISDGKIREYNRAAELTLERENRRKRAEIDRMLENATSLGGRIASIDREIDGIAARVKSIEDLRPTAISVFETAMSLAQIPLVGIEASAVEEWGDLANDLSIAAGLWTFDKLRDKVAEVVAPLNDRG
jgi:ElaB/YqjD/DUF883 family membrane-anchored ribosome-binding protein